jgi:ApaG protein
MSDISTSPSLVTEGIRISVQSMFLPEQSSSKTNTYCFAYRITIVNESESTVQLMRRHWDITDGYGSVRVVEGDGVIGLQPTLKPGEEHSYVSGSVMPSTIGKMEGYYEMERPGSGGEVIPVNIPPFLLITPYLLN